MTISTRIAALEESQSLQMAARCAQMRAEGVDVISMSLGEPDFPTPEHIREAAKQAVDDNWSHYGPVPGIPTLRKAIAATTKGYTADDIIVSVGAKQAICNAIQTLINPGDEVLLPTPCWVSYSEMVKLAEGRNVFIRTRMEDRFLVTAEQLEQAITPRTRLLVLCSPNNPTGSVYSREQLQSIVDVLVRHPEISVIADEIYSPIHYAGPCASFQDFPEIRSQLILIGGVSKAYAMTGYRIGWLACADRAFISACKRLQGQQITCATMVAQKAAEAAYLGPQESVEQMRQVFAERRELIMQLASEIPGFRFAEPEGAFYLFPDVTAYFGRTLRGFTIHSANDMVEYLLNEAHVSCVSGAAFGEDTCIRLSYAIDTQAIRECMARIRRALTE